MNSVELRKIDELNYLDCFNLKLWSEICVPSDTQSGSGVCLL